MLMRSWHTLLAVLVLSSGVVGLMMAGENPPQETRPGRELKLLEIHDNLRYSPADWAAIHDTLHAEDDEQDGQRGFALIDQGPQVYAVVHVEFENAASRQAFEERLQNDERLDDHQRELKGTHVISRFDRFADLFIPADDGGQVRDAITSAPGFVWMDRAVEKLRPPPPPVQPEESVTRQVPAPIVRGGINGLSGNGVVIAILDTGVDFRHPDFITYDAEGRPTSRLLYFWDTDSDLHVLDLGSPAPVTYPNGSPIGTVYCRDDLTAELRRARPRIPVSDFEGHGTACASVAAGNGNASDGAHQGVAPQADLIAVRLGSYGLHDAGVGKHWLIGAICDWLESVVDDRPLVVSCSYGGTYGGHDGFHVEERQLDARFDLDRSGRAICISAGNSGDWPVHAEAILEGTGEYATIEWQLEAPAAIDLFIDSDCLETIDIRYDGSVIFMRPEVHGLTRHLRIPLRTLGGRGALYLASFTGRAIRADAYIRRPVGQAIGLGDDDQGFGIPPRKLVATPACARNAITVGSFNWNDEFEHHGRTFLYPDSAQPGQLMAIGSLSGYSSPGPLRFGDVVKPDIAAPGQWYAASLPLNVRARVLEPIDGPPVIARDITGFYTPFTGTSAAAPYAAGVIALLMEKKPDVTLGQIKELLHTCASVDQQTGETPNPQWGYGKLDRAAVERMLAKLEE